MGAVPGRRSQWDRAGWEGKVERLWFFSCLIPSPSLMGIPFLSCLKRHSQAIILIPSRRGSGREHTSGCSCPRLWSSHLKGSRAAQALRGWRSKLSLEIFNSLLNTWLFTSPTFWIKMQFCLAADAFSRFSLHSGNPKLLVRGFSIFCDTEWINPCLHSVLCLVPD